MSHEMVEHCARTATGLRSQRVDRTRGVEDFQRRGRGGALRAEDGSRPGVVFARRESKGMLIDDSEQANGLKQTRQRPGFWLRETTKPWRVCGDLNLGRCPGWYVVLLRSDGGDESLGQEWRADFLQRSSIDSCWKSPGRDDSLKAEATIDCHEDATEPTAHGSAHCYRPFVDARE